MLKLKNVVVTGVVWVALALNGVVCAAGTKDARDVFEKTKHAAEFANHVEQGVDAVQAVQTTKKVVGVTTGGVGTAVVNKTVEEVVENNVEDFVQDEFRELVEDEVGNQVSGSVRGHAKSNARKALVR